MTLPFPGTPSRWKPCNAWREIITILVLLAFSALAEDRQDNAAHSSSLLSPYFSISYRSMQRTAHPTELPEASWPKTEAAILLGNFIDSGPATNQWEEVTPSVTVARKQGPSRYYYATWITVHSGFGEIFADDKIGHSRTSGAGFEDSRSLYMKMSWRF